MNTTISENIRKFRELRGFSQDYMAHKMNLSQSAYAKIEKENTKLTVDRLQSISEILEVDVASLINASKQKQHQVTFHHMIFHECFPFGIYESNSLPQAAEQFISFF